MAQKDYKYAWGIARPHLPLPAPQIFPNRRWRQLRSKPIIVFAGLFILFFLAIEVFIINFSRLSSPVSYPDTFTPYSAILPGHPATNLDHYACQLQVFEGRGESAVTCDLHAAQTAFYSLTALIRNGFIEEVTFRTDRLMIGDVAQLCGHPSLALTDRKMRIARWLHFGNCTLFVPAGETSYLLPVQSVLLSGH